MKAFFIKHIVTLILSVLIIGLLIVSFILPTMPSSELYSDIDIKFTDDGTGCLKVHPASLDLNIKDNTFRFRTTADILCEFNDSRISLYTNNIEEPATPKFKFGNVSFKTEKTDNRFTYVLNTPEIESKLMYEIEIQFPLKDVFSSRYTFNTNKEFDYLFFTYKKDFYGYVCDDCIQIIDGALKRTERSNLENSDFRKCVFEEDTRTIRLAFNPESQNMLWLKDFIYVLTMGLLVTLMYDLGRRYEKYSEPFFETEIGSTKIIENLFINVLAIAFYAGFAMFLLKFYRSNEPNFYALTILLLGIAIIFLFHDKIESAEISEKKFKVKLLQKQNQEQKLLEAETERLKQKYAFSEKKVTITRPKSKR
jgi:hypothetical protein